MRTTFLLLALLFGYGSLAAQSCLATESEVIVEILTDNYGYETSWSLSSGTTVYWSIPGNTYANAQLYVDTVCVPSNTCIAFQIEDSFGDGICCNYGTGYYNVYVDGLLMASGGAFTDSASVSFNCPPGSACNSGDSVVVGGPYSSTFDDHWYVFIPDSSGMYEITTCGLNTCNTEIWVYDDCMANIDETVAGTVFYDDDNGGCGQQAVVSAAMTAGSVYYIRMGDANDDCSSAVQWNLQYNGPITGCTDPSACNYNPLATISDTCIYPGDPNCPGGPDLVLLQPALQNSMFLTTYFSNDPCQVDEQCIQGMGDRDIIRFTTHIENNGTQDYFIGSPSTHPNQFSNNNCHGHWHYEGYAEYILYSQSLTPIPIGFKSGFCVMDLVCDQGGTAQYGCSNMGITAGCGDIYDASLDCQWIDITTVPDGDYTFVARVNWGNQPDALGRHEMTYDNNWAQVCFNINRSSGSPVMTINPNCPTFVDCAGVPLGSAIPDCNGICQGAAVRGDLDLDTVLSNIDVNLYLDNILDNSLAATECNDLHRDTILNVYDAALLAQCMLDSNECDFPSGISNIFDTTYLSITNVDFDDNYLDISIRNPNNRVLGYQFTMSGLTIDSVINLVSNAVYPVQPIWSSASNRVIGLSQIDSSISKSAAPQALCRIYFSNISANQLCIADFEAAVSSDYQAVMTAVEGPCVMPSVSTVVPEAFDYHIKVQPNPFSGNALFKFNNPQGDALTLEILDATGRVLRIHRAIDKEAFVLEQGGLASGMYFYRLRGPLGMYTGKITIK